MQSLNAADIYQSSCNFNFKPLGIRNQELYIARYRMRALQCLGFDLVFGASKEKYRKISKNTIKTSRVKKNKRQ